MNKIILINQSNDALLDFIQFAYKEKYNILKTEVHDKHDVISVFIQTKKTIKWHFTDNKGNRYLNLSSIEFPL